MAMSERERQMMLEQLRGMTSNIGGAATPLASIMPTPATAPKGTISPEDLASLGKMRRKPSNAMEAIMGATSPTMGTALAKAVVSGIAGHRGRKEAKTEATALEKSMQKKADEFEVAQVRKRAREDAADKRGVAADLRGEAADLRGVATDLRGVEAGKLAERKVVVTEGRLEFDKKKEKATNLGKPETWWDTQNGVSRNFQFDQHGSPYDMEGNPASLRNYTDSKPSGTDYNQDGSPKPLTENQAAIRLETLETKLNPLQGVQSAIVDIDAMLATFAKGGDREGENIPGIGFGEGLQGSVGDIIRWMGPKGGQQIMTAMTELTTARMRKLIGSQQTLLETQKALRSMGQQPITNEETAVTAFLRFRDAFERDMDRLRNATHPDVMARFQAGYEKAGTKSPFDVKLEPMEFEGIERFGHEPAGLTPRQKRLLELKKQQKKLAGG